MVKINNNLSGCKKKNSCPSGWTEQYWKDTKESTCIEINKEEKGILKNYHVCIILTLFNLKTKVKIIKIQFQKLLRPGEELNVHAKIEVVTSLMLIQKKRIIFSALR